MSRLAPMLVLAFAGAALAQSRSAATPARPNQAQGVRAAAPRPMSGLGGVHSQPGVRIGFPQTQPLGQPLNQPQFRPLPVGPWPGTVINNAPAPTAPNAPSIVAPNVISTPAFNTDPFIVRNHGGNAFINSGSGLTVNGSFNDDNFRLRFHIGTDPTLLIPRRHHHHFHSFPASSPVVFWYPGWWYGDPFYSNRYEYIYGNYSAPDPAVYNAVMPAQPQAQVEPVRPSTDRELADTYLRAGDAKSAIKSYKSHLKQYPGDEDAMRALGLALIDSGQTAEGVAMIAMAYRAEPLLADRPMNADALRDGDDGLRRDLQRASIYANSAKTSSAWLTVAILMQAERRNDTARTMLDRAQAAGLESGLYDRMSSALQ